MKCTVYFYLLNSDYSQELADQKHNGEESEDNMMFEWEDELEITDDVNLIDIHESASLPLEGEMPDGTSFTEELTDMRIFECKHDDEQIAVLGCSESILDSYNIEESPEGLELYVYLKDKEPMANPVPGLYIASQEFPRSLIL